MTSSCTPGGTNSTGLLGGGVSDFDSYYGVYKLHAVPEFCLVVMSNNATTEFWFSSVWSNKHSTLLSSHSTMALSNHTISGRNSTMVVERRLDPKGQLGS